MTRKSLSETPLRWFVREPVEHAEPRALDRFGLVDATDHLAGRGDPHKPEVAVDDVARDLGCYAGRFGIAVDA